MPGPDFPTGAMICGTDGIRAAYATGRGLLTVRARAEFEDDASAAARIVVTEIPFMVNKARMLERIAELVREGKIDGIADLRDEIQPRGHARRDRAQEATRRGDVVLNQLYKLTPLQTTFGVNLLALVNGRPQTLSLKEALAALPRLPPRSGGAPRRPTTSRRPRRAPTSSRASRSRSTTSTR